MSATDNTVEFDRTLLGVRRAMDRFPMVIKAEEIMRYSTVLGETYSCYFDEKAAKLAGFRGVLAPPAFSTALTIGMGKPDVGLKDVGASFLATEAVHRFGPICAGDTLVANFYLKNVYRKTGRSGSMVFVVWAIEFTNQMGDLIETTEKSYVYKGVSK